MQKRETGSFQESENEKRKEGRGRKTEMEVIVARTRALTMAFVAPQSCPPEACTGRGDVGGGGHTVPDNLGFLPLFCLLF